MNLRNKLLGIGTVGLAVVLPLFNHLPATASIPNPVSIIAQAVKQPQVILNLAVAKKNTEVTVDGKKQVNWQQLEDNAAVAPGDVLRYTITGENTGESAAKNLAVTQPIPAQMIYKPDSAASKNDADITYSIDQGETFVAKPTIKVTQEDGTVVERPAPPESYTHIRWQFPLVTPEQGATAMYEVRVQ
ncbi:DUF11 domain-containing protein [Pleurocapsales cyanobacterium LEGE 10410]|nr:DUF11 domain-containing protein [Pleurocapsales cyanobacterium LEGE 10410]